MSTWSEDAFKIRYRNSEGFGSVEVFAKNGNQAVAKAHVNGRIISVRKMSPEDILRIGDNYVKKWLLPDPNGFRLENLFKKIENENKTR